MSWSSFVRFSLHRHSPFRCTRTKSRRAASRMSRLVEWWPPRTRWLDEKRKFQNVSICTRFSWKCQPNLAQLYALMIDDSVQDGKLNQTQTSLRQHRITIASPHNALFTLTVNPCRCPLGLLSRSTAESSMPADTCTRSLAMTFLRLNLERKNESCHWSHWIPSLL